MVFNYDIKRDNMLSDKLSDLCVGQLINTRFFQNPNMQKLSEVFTNPFNTLVSLYCICSGPCTRTAIEPMGRACLLDKILGIS